MSTSVFRSIAKMMNAQQPRQPTAVTIPHLLCFFFGWTKSSAGGSGSGFSVSSGFSSSTGFSCISISYCYSTGGYIGCWSGGYIGYPGCCITTGGPAGAIIGGPTATATGGPAGVIIGGPGGGIGG